HYSLDPGQAATITRNIVDGLARVAPDHRAEFERRRQEFLGRLDTAMARWTTMLAPVRGAKVIVYHPQWIYLLTRFGLVQAAALEDRPGIPPSPAHVARVIRGAVERQEVRDARRRGGRRQGHRPRGAGGRRQRRGHLHRHAGIQRQDPGRGATLAP
ncbi:MAG: zinc ABC transporter substrate-binding protein, partial [Candidatus Rokubacteria bacterium]|nr:zinc ABC transporter substrate-binding protein [Candidatus Rokubacteria bacterium]